MVFLLILDGFDEINPESRDDIEQQILEISRNYPDILVVVSSRSDPRFKGWQNFYSFNIEKLSQKQSIDVIDKANYDSGIKRRFVKDIPNLWPTHNTFLSVPLLSVIMLITFGKFSEISPKTTLFYKLAFQTLFREHDAHKEQFKRPLYSALDLDDFERCFSAFCALSYTEGRISFSKSQAKKYSSDAIKFSRLNSDAEGYVKDLIDNVCMLQEEGTDLTFVHRSFQEYFCAVFASGYHEDNVLELFDKIATKDSDSTLSMIKEIDESKFEIDWLLPTLRTYIESLKPHIDNNNAVESMYWIFRTAVFFGKENVSAFYVTKGHKSSILRNIGKIYPEYQDRLSIGELFRLFTRSSLSTAVQGTKFAKQKRFAFLFNNAEEQVDLEFRSADEPWLQKLGIVREMSRILNGLQDLESHILSCRQGQNSILRL